MTTHADVMGRATACPECPNTEPPRDAVETYGGWLVAYLCSDCGWAWTIDYPAVSFSGDVSEGSETMGGQLKRPPGGASTPSIPRGLRPDPAKEL